MSSVGRTRRVVGAIFAAAMLVGGGFVPSILAVGPDKGEVVLVFDFSASILDDAETRNQFAGALERMADRVGETQRDLIAGDTTVSIVQFASRAADYEGCTDITLLGSPSSVRTFADCLRSVARDYRAGLNPTLTRRIGNDTNYVAAMEQAATHLPADATRPTMILFSDGKHDVAGVPVSAVAPARDRLFGDRAPFALLPVGMGLDPAARPALEAGLAGLRTIHDMPPCSSGAAVEWPQVVFDSPDDAGVAVAVALQNATCTFTAAPVGPSPTPPAGTARSIRLTPHDGAIEVTWSPPANPPEAIVDYRVRCLADGADPIESADGISTEHSAVVEGLTNGTEYRCEVAADSASTEGEWVAAGLPATPAAIPAPPAKPTVEAQDGAVRIGVAPDGVSQVSTYRFECSPDQTTWATVEVPGSGDATAQLTPLVNGVEYVCRAFAANETARARRRRCRMRVRPCSSFLECSGLSTPMIIGIAALLIGALLLGILALMRSRGGGYTVAVVDVIHTANLGGGSNLGLRFERTDHDVAGIAAAGGRKADIKIRKLRGDRFKVHDSMGWHVAASGEPIVIVDSGSRHELVLRAFAGKAASAASVRR